MTDDELIEETEEAKKGERFTSVEDLIEDLEN